MFAYASAGLIGVIALVGVTFWSAWKRLPPEPYTSFDKGDERSS